MEKLIIIKTLAELNALRTSLEDKDFIALDTETTGVDKESEIIGFSVCTDVDTGYYCILSYWDVKEQKLVYLETREGAKSFFESLQGKSLIGQNFPFDAAMIKNNYGVDLMPSLHTDTLVSGHLLNENRSNGLKERGIALYGEDAGEEQRLMKASVVANGGMLTKDNYELYKADADLIAKYGAKDAILTMKIFIEDVESLYSEGLDAFYYQDETIPLLKGPTFDMNTTGLSVDPDKLQVLKSTLETEIMEAKSFIYKEIEPFIKDKYPGTSKAKTFNINAGQQMAWLLFSKLEQEFTTLTDSGRDMCKALGWKVPYAPGAKRQFIQLCLQNFGLEYVPAGINKKTGKKTLAKKVGEPWKYMTAGIQTKTKYAQKYKWVQKLLEHGKNTKLLSTYVEGIQSRMKYNVIRPNFLQHGTTSGRYSCKNPNFHNLPRDDKRVKACIVSRQGKVFVGADYSQLEPRVFASYSGDERLLKCFKDGDDFYSVIGAEVFDKHGCSLKKSDPNSFAKLHEGLRNRSKVVALAATYGALGPQLAPTLQMSIDDAQGVIDDYFERFPSVRKFMLDTHEEVKTNGFVVNLFGRPRRMPKALAIRELFGNTQHKDLPREYRNLLNLAVNHKTQSTGASIMNRATISAWTSIQELSSQDPRWKEVKIVLQIHDEVILEGPEALAEDMVAILKDAMENTVTLPGVDLVAEPKVAYNLADLK